MSLLNLILTLISLLPRKIFFKFTLALKQWLVCTTFSAIIRLHLRIHSSKNYSLVFLHASTLISSIIMLTNTLRMKNQSIRSTPQNLHFTLTIQLTFLKHFYFYFLQLQDFYHKDGTRHTKGPPAENDRRPEGGPEP